MFKLLEQLKHRLSHVRAGSWHWKATKRIFESYAYGKACTYYWFKLPLSLLALLIITVVWVVISALGVLYVVLGWICGFRLGGKVFDTNHSVLESLNYYDYKERPDGTKARFAPWEIILIPVLIWLVWFLAFVRSDIGKITLYMLVGILSGSLIVYFITASWKLPLIVQARANVRAAWDKICPVLVVVENQEEGDDD